MRIGGSLLLIAIGAIMRFAVTIHNPHGFNIYTAGVILMIVGVIGLILSFFWLTMWRDRRRGAVVEDRRYVDDRPYVP